MSSESLFPGTRDLSFPEYNFVVEDLRTNKIVAEYPLMGVKYNNAIKTVGKFSGKIGLTPEIMKQNPRKTLETNNHGIYVLRNYEPVWAGILKESAYEEASNSVTISAVTYESWFDTRILTRDINVKNVDQLEIARQYVTSGGAAEAMGIEVDSSMSGFKRERNSYAYELNTIWDELSRLSNLINGFDFRIIPYRDGSTSKLKKRLTFGYPILSTNTKDTPAYLFESNRNIIDSKVKFTSDDAASRVYAIGEGEGTSQKVAIADDAASIEAGYPRYEKSASYKGVKVHSTLVSHAHSILEENRNPLTDISVTIRGNDDPYVGSYAPGDWVRIKLDNIWFPEGYDRTFRITEVAVSLSDSGQETVTMDFSGPYIRDNMVIKDSTQSVYVPPEANAVKEGE